MLQREQPAKENGVRLVAVKDVVDALTQPVHGEEGTTRAQSGGRVDSP